MKISLDNFFFKLPIYKPVKSEEEVEDLFGKLFYPAQNKVEFTGYNPIHKFESTYHVVYKSRDRDFSVVGGIETVEVKCKRSDGRFTFLVLWNPREHSLTKVGQYPSIADFHIAEVSRYEKLLTREKLKELTRAIGLAANGVGIGSYVYLRRLFEHLITNAYETCRASNGVVEDEYTRARMDKKIEMLSSHLPEFLVKNKGIYSILSLGVHELDEETCLAHFDTLRTGIELILDEQLETLEKTKKAQAAEKSLGELRGRLKSSKQQNHERLT